MLTKVEGTTLTFDVNGKISTYEIDEVCHIDQDDVTGDMMRQASLFGFFSAMLSRMEWQTVKARAAMEREYGQADEVARADIISRGEKIREAAVTGLVNNDEVYITASEAHQEAVYLQSVLQNLCKTLHMKSDMLISIGAQMRAELHMTGLRTKESAYEDNIAKLKDKV